jgi:hypothetical protein
VTRDGIAAITVIVRRSTSIGSRLQPRPGAPELPAAGSSFLALFEKKSAR